MGNQLELLKTPMTTHWQPNREHMLRIEKDTFGVDDRFAHQAAAQLRAFELLADDGIEVTPVWNKLNREHPFVGSQPQSVFDAAARAVKHLGWEKPWHIDADHIQLATVDPFLPCSEFFCNRRGRLDRQTSNVLRRHRLR